MGLVLVALALGSPPARGADPGSLELAWLAELGAEAWTVGPRPPDSQEAFWVSVPGAVLGFRVDANGTPSKTARLPADFSSAYGLATSRESAVVASRQGEVALWRHPTAGRAPELVWRRTMGS